VPRALSSAALVSPTSVIEPEFHGSPPSNVVTYLLSCPGYKVNNAYVVLLHWAVTIREAAERQQCSVQSTGCKCQDEEQVLVLPEPEANSSGKREVKVTNLQSDTKLR
jgi:hypothetical protein